MRDLPLFKTAVLIIFVGVNTVAHAAEVETFANTKPLKLQGDIASTLVDGVDKFLLRQLEQSIAKRAKYWNRNFESAAAYNRSIQANRQRLAHILGVRDKRTAFAGMQLTATTDQPALIGQGKSYKVYAVQWPVIRNIHGVGLLLVPSGPIVANVIAIPDADQTPEQLVGLVDGTDAKSQYARRLAESGCRVVVPMLIHRTKDRYRSRAFISRREFVWRGAFELGRHMIGYELQKTLAVVDWFSRENQRSKSAPTAIIGWGEGGLLALYAGALDERISAVAVSGYFQSRQKMWDEPLSRSVFGLLEQFGDAEVAAMIAPRRLIIEAAQAPEVKLDGKGGGGPSQLTTPALAAVRNEVVRANRITKPLQANKPIEFVVSGKGKGPAGSAKTLQALLAAVGTKAKLAPSQGAPKVPSKNLQLAKRHRAQLDELIDHNQWLLHESHFVRQRFMQPLTTSTKSMKEYKKAVEEYRKIFRHDVIGHFNLPMKSPNPRTRKKYKHAKWTGYEVALDVFPGVIAYGVLLMPNDIKPGEKRPVVVCQHGLEGRPRDVITGNHYAYHDFAAKLAERGFITFAPQNLYIFRDRFRTLQRKANPLKKTLFSIIVPQHQQIVNWLSDLPQVDKKRIAFYGLSYGGKSAMRIPPLVTDYCLSICSADFNEWVLKNASSRHNFSYIGTGEYEIFEWDLGSTFNYAEMAALICPRPFMVERGHFDGVGRDPWVAFEFAKVRHLYAAKLFIPDRCEIEWFYGKYKGVHTINGQATFRFLHKHLKWPRR